MPPCIVLAGGLGTRLRSAVSDLPKCLAPVGNRPFIEIQINTLLAAGVKEVILSLGYMSDKVVDALQNSTRTWHVRHVIEPTPLGTGGAIVHVMEQFGLDEVLVTNGDTYLDADISGMRTPLNRARGEFLRMAVVRVPDRSRFGGVEIDANGQVFGFLEKGQKGWGEINAGLYRLCRQALPELRRGAYSLETDVLPGLVKRGAVSALRIGGSFADIGVPADYLRFCAQHAS